MRLGELRTMAREGIDPPSTEPLVFPAQFSPEVQAVWDQFQEVAADFRGLPMNRTGIAKFRSRLIHVLRAAHRSGVMKRVPWDAIDGLQVEADGSTIDVVWPAAVRIFFEEEAERWKGRQT